MAIGSEDKLTSSDGMLLSVETLRTAQGSGSALGRDFQRFMGMSASDYKARPHPFLNAAVHGRMAAAGAGMQALHDPATDRTT